MSTGPNPQVQAYKAALTAAVAAKVAELAIVHAKEKAQFDRMMPHATAVVLKSLGLDPNDDSVLEAIDPSVFQLIELIAQIMMDFLNRCAEVGGGPFAGLLSRMRAATAFHEWRVGRRIKFALRWSPQATSQYEDKWRQLGQEAVRAAKETPEEEIEAIFNDRPVADVPGLLI